MNEDIAGSLNSIKPYRKLEVKPEKNIHKDMKYKPHISFNENSSVKIIRAKIATDIIKNLLITRSVIEKYDAWLFALLWISLTMIG